MSKVSVVTDSSADLAPGIAGALGIHVVPMTTYVGSEVRPLDPVDGPSLWEEVRGTEGIVRTAQPTPGDFYETYAQILEGAGSDGEIISIHLSKHLSGTVRSAHLAAEMLGGSRITVIDSGLVGPPLGQVAVEAASQAGEDYGLEEVKDLVYAVISQMRVLLYAGHPNGMSGSYQGLLGRLSTAVTSPFRANILSLDRGEIMTVGRCRDDEQATARLAGLLDESQSGLRRLRLVGVMYAGTSAPPRMMEAINKHLDSGVEVEEYAMGPVIGGILGPGSLGVFTVG